MVMSYILMDIYFWLLIVLFVGNPRIWFFISEEEVSFLNGIQPLRNLAIVIDYLKENDKTKHKKLTVIFLRFKISKFVFYNPYT